MMKKLKSSKQLTIKEKTTNFFNQEFKGFEFDLGEKKISYEPKDVNSVIQNQSDLNNFIKSFLDEKGSLKDAKKYHTALHMAMNPESYAKFFYEQGRADSVDSIVKKGKNIDMAIRTKVDSSKTGTKFTVLKDNKSGFGNSLKIKR